MSCGQEVEVSQKVNTVQEPDIVVEEVDRFDEGASVNAVMEVCHLRLQIP
jgi:hypothetical protein